MAMLNNQMVLFLTIWIYLYLSFSDFDTYDIHIFMEYLTVP